MPDQAPASLADTRYVERPADLAESPAENDLRKSGQVSQEDATFPETSADGSADDDPADVGGVWNARSILLVVAAVVMALCAAGSITAYRMYDKATRAQVDRSDPEVVVSKYIDAYFNRRDTMDAQRYVCKSPKLSNVENVVADLQSREQKFNIKFAVSVANPNKVVSGDRATVTVDLELRSNAPSYSRASWSFVLARESGWRVCAATKLG